MNQEILNAIEADAGAALKLAAAVVPGAQALVLADALLGGVEAMLPKIVDEFSGGSVPADKQKALFDRIQSFRDALSQKIDPLFAGPEWQLSTSATETAATADGPAASEPPGASAAP